MAKRIQLVLSEDVSKLGRSGDLVEVAPGYARNYLIPRGKQSMSPVGFSSRLSGAEKLNG